DYQPSTIAEGPRRQDDSAADDDEARPPNKAETVTLAVIEQNVPMLADAQALVGRFHAMIRRKAEIELEPWIEESKRSLIASFANGIANDKGAVHAAITQP
ncbi:transposase, partial [Bradyrhizobium sp. 23]|nr:transposase [Bradyrhizobium sp. 23]